MRKYLKNILSSDYDGRPKQSEFTASTSGQNALKFDRIKRELDETRYSTVILRASCNKGIHIKIPSAQSA